MTKCDREDHGRLRHVHKFKNFRKIPSSNLRITVHFSRIHVHQSQFDRERGCDKHYEIVRETHVIMELILCMFHYVKFIILCACFSVLSPSRCNWNFGTRITVHFTRIHVHQSQFDRERGCDKHYEIFRETCYYGTDSMYVPLRQIYYFMFLFFRTFTFSV